MNDKNGHIVIIDQQQRKDVEVKVEPASADTLREESLHIKQMQSEPVQGLN